MDHSLEFILNHPVLSVALFIFIYLIISFEIKNFTKKYKAINCSDLVTKINDSNIVVLDTREKADYKKGHISNAICHDSSSTKKLDYEEVVVYDKDEVTSVGSAEKILKITVSRFYIWKVVFNHGTRIIFHSWRADDR